MPIFRLSLSDLGSTMTVKPMSHKSIFLILLILGVSSQVSPASVRAWRLDSDALIPGEMMPPGRALVPPTEADFEGNGQIEKLTVTDGQAAILSASGVVWTSPAGWMVQQAAVTDLDHDGRPEATLLVWRPFKPWPVDQWLPFGGRIADFHDAQGLSCHLILIGRRGDRYAEVWAGSALAEPVHAFAAADLNGDGRQELVTLDGRYSDGGLHPGNPQGVPPARELKVWEWNGFGFSVVSSITGSFGGMAIVQAANGRFLILTP